MDDSTVEGVGALLTAGVEISVLRERGELDLADGGLAHCDIDEHRRLTYSYFVVVTQDRTGTGWTRTLEGHRSRQANDR